MGSTKYVDFDSKVDNDDGNDENQLNNPWMTTEAVEYRQLLENAIPSYSKEGAYKIIDNIMRQSKRIGELPSKMMRERWRWESLRKPPPEETKMNEGACDGSNCDDDNDGDEEELEEFLGPNNDDVRKDDSMSVSNATCIGSIFGLDVGGTLSKLLYFEEKPQASARRSSSDITETPRSNYAKRKFKSARYASTPNMFQESKEEMEEIEELEENDEDDEDDEREREKHVIGENFSSDSPSLGEEGKNKMNRSYSLFDIASKEEERQQALERFYAFVRQLDTYGSDLKDKSSSFYSRTLGGEFHFIQFETRYIGQAMDLIKSNNLHLDINQIGATGGGAHKYASRWDEQLGIKIAKQDELDSLVAGMQFILADVVGECYTFKPNEKAFETAMKARMNENNVSSGSLPSTETKVSNELSGTKTDGNTVEEIRSRDKTTASSKDSNTPSKSKNSEDVPKKIHGLDQYWWSRKVKRDFIAKSDSYPYLLVMIGTGVSVVRVDGPRKHERISGSTIGGGTYWGLCRLLTDAEDFESVLNLAERGDPSKVDM